MARALIEKSVDGTFPIGLKYYPDDLDTDETITTVTNAITPAGELAVDGAVSIAGDGKSFSWVIKDGIAGTEYIILFKVTTSTGKIFNHPIRESIIVEVVS